MVDELYQEVILDHNKNPRNFGELKGVKSSEGFNPLCGDKVKVFVDIKDDIIMNISFVGVGCAISTASASMMTESVKGKTVSEAQRLFEEFHDLITKKQEGKHLEKLALFSGVSSYPSRTKCATLCWHTLHKLLKE